MKMTARYILKAILLAAPLLCVIPPTVCSPLLLSPLRPARLSNSLQAHDSTGEGDMFYKSDWIQMSQAPPRLVQAVVGERLELECEAVGSRPVIEWGRGGEQVTENDSYESNSISFPEVLESSPGLSKIRARLIINSVLPPHQGSITCLATSGSKTVAASTVLIVSQGPVGMRNNLTTLFGALPLNQPRSRIVLWSPVRMSLQGSDVTLPCRAVGHPVPQVYWLDNQGEVVGEQNTRVKVLPDGELQIKNLAWRDMGAYTCIARNAFSKDSISTFIYPLLNEN